MPERNFAAAYEQHVSQVYGYFGYALSSREDVEDLTQQTFERALRSWERYDESRGGAAPWLMAIARNLLVDHMRAAGTARTEPVDLADLDVMEAAPDRYRVGLEPDIERALFGLGERERELIALRFGGDLRGCEIASLTGLSVANVQQILSRSLRRMRASLDREVASVGGAVAR